MTDSITALDTGMLSVANKPSTPNVVMLSVIMLNVVAPKNDHKILSKYLTFQRAISFCILTQPLFFYKLATVIIYLMSQILSTASFFSFYKISLHNDMKAVIE
jgi:hypothetical protein